jgi:hypothetical protein
MSTDTSHTQEQKNPIIQLQKAEGLTEHYADNTQLLSSNWSLELVFGHLDQKQGPQVVVQTGSVTMPWPAAKALLYFLQLHVMGHESAFGRIILPPGIIPEFPAQKPKDLSQVKDETFQAARQYYLDFIARNPEAVLKPK